MSENFSLILRGDKERKRGKRRHGLDGISYFLEGSSLAGRYIPAIGASELFLIGIFYKFAGKAALSTRPVIKTMLIGLLTLLFFFFIIIIIIELISHFEFIKRGCWHLIEIRMSSSNLSLIYFSFLSNENLSENFGTDKKKVDCFCH